MIIKLRMEWIVTNKEVSICIITIIINIQIIVI